MDVFKEEQFSSAHLGHLGLVADKIESLKIIGLIDNRLPISEAYGTKVSHGECVAAMIMNGLGFIDSRLYLFPEFLSDKPLDSLFNRHVQAEWFNDDASGRVFRRDFSLWYYQIIHRVKPHNWTGPWFIGQKHPY